MMAKSKVIAVEEVEEIEEIEEEEGEESEGGTNILTAKQAASKLGTDGRTLRKYLRSKFGLVGQGQRWSIEEDDLDNLRIEFKKWNKGTKKPKKVTSKPDPEEDLDEAELEELEEVEELDLDD